MNVLFFVLPYAWQALYIVYNVKEEIESLYLKEVYEASNVRFFAQPSYMTSLRTASKPARLRCAISSSALRVIMSIIADH